MMHERLKRFFARPDDGPRAPWRIFWVALAVRLLYMTLAHTYRIRLYDDHFEFGWEIGRIARALATGYGFADPFNGHSGPTAWTPPLYPLLLAGVFKVFGVYTTPSAWVILALNCLFSAATAPAVYEIAARCFGRAGRGLNMAAWSGWLWALYPAAMQYGVKWIWDTSLSTFLFAWAVVVALRLRGIGAESATASQTAARWMQFGLLWGAIGLTNSSLLLFLPACGLWILWGANWSRLVPRAALGAAVCAAAMGPWVLRNELAFHHFVPLRSNFGAELFESIQPTNQGFPWGVTVSLDTRSAQFRRYRELGELEYCRRQGQRAIEQIKAYPARFAGYTLKRVYFFWFGVPHPTDKSLAGEIIRELNFGFISVGGLLGLGLALRRGIPGAALFAWAFALVPLIYYLVTVQARFRHPLEPLMTVLIVYLFQSAERPQTAARKMRMQD